VKHASIVHALVMNSGYR